ncbi:MAG TPA: sulfite exporter TauE/SafE family protein [Candidatus Uhrbacteria bacterium]|nr:sulfite exporter TauE/SafE family protein [Candidatus Uhrbacteria bacterium]
MEIFQILNYALIGIITGFFSGMFGIGGGSIRVPLLAMTGMSLINAFATNMFAMPFSSATGAYTQRKNIKWGVAKLFTIGGVAGIFVATYFVGIVSNKVLAATFFFAALLTILGLYLNKISHKIYDKIKPTAINLFSGAFLVNLIIGLRGGSGGTLFPPLLRTMNIEMHHAIATSLFAGIFSSLVALGVYFWRGNVIFLPAIIVATTGILGSYLGSELSIRTESKWLKLGLAIIVFILACTVIYREFF